MTTIKLKNGSGAPAASDLVQGEPAFDLTNKRLYTEDSGGNVIEVGTNPGTDVTFADNRKAVFGAGSDLQIYHDGSNSFIDDTGTGSLIIRAADNLEFQKYTGETYITAAADGAVDIYYNDARKLQTASTGVDITGTVTADGLTVDGNPLINGTSPQLFLQTGASNYNWQIAAQENVSDAFEISSGSADADATNDTYTKRLVVQQSGDISFYEDTGTTAKFHWDASAESLGIGTSTVHADIHLGADSPHIDIGPSTGNRGKVGFDSNNVYIGSTSGTGEIHFKNNIGSTDAPHSSGDTKMVITDSGVGIDTSSPSSFSGDGDNLVVGTTSGNNGISIISATDGSGNLYFGDTETTGGGSRRGQLVYDHATDSMRFATAVTERMRLDSSGNFLVGKSSSSFGTAGSELQSDGAVTLTRDGGTVFFVNRLTSNGELAAFYKDSTQVGTAGTDGSNIYIGTGDTTLKMDAGSDGIFPRGANGAQRDGAIQLGSAGNRFSDFYLKGNINFLGGTNDAQYIKFGDSDDDDIGNIFYYHGNNNMVFTTNASEAFRVDGSGNVGIGTSSVTSVLDVVGPSARPASLAEVDTASTARFRADSTNNDSLYIAEASSGMLVQCNDGATNSTTAKPLNLQLFGGNVGIGVVPETDWHSNYTALQVNTGGALASYASGTVFGTVISTNQRTTGDTFVGGNKYIASKAAQLYLQDNSGNHIWYNAPSGTADDTISYSERARIDSSGNLLVGTTGAITTGNGFSVNSTGQARIGRASTGSIKQIIFSNPNGEVGSIATSGSATAFNTSSDQRLKDNIVDAPSASDNIDAIQVRSFDWKADGSHQKYGMVAQELQGVAPDAVSGDADSDEMMSIDYSKLVPMLVKEIQSLRARVAQLEGEN